MLKTQKGDCHIEIISYNCIVKLNKQKIHFKKRAAK